MIPRKQFGALCAFVLGLNMLLAHVLMGCTKPQPRTVNTVLDVVSDECVILRQLGDDRVDTACATADQLAPWVKMLLAAQRAAAARAAASAGGSASAPPAGSAGAP
jgi:hypothetical protein